LPEAMGPGMPARPAARYRLYIDESGDHSYNLLEDPSHGYLAPLGVWFRQYSGRYSKLHHYRGALHW
jgi:hypothetical protein